MPTAATSGRWPSRSSSRARKSAISRGAGNRLGASVSRPSATPPVRKPGSTRASAASVRSRLPLPATSTMLAAISATIRPPRRRRAGRPELAPAASRSGRNGSRRQIRTAGSTPATSPAASPAASVQATPAAPSLTASSRGVAGGARPRSTARDAPPSSSPTAAAATATSRLSAISCLTTRPRPAPRASRSASSESRPMARVRNRLPALTAATSSTRAAAASSSSSGLPAEPTTESSSGARLAPTPRSSFGCSAASTAATRAMSDRAAAGDTPSASLPTTSTYEVPKSSAGGSRGIGTHSSARGISGAWNPAGITPTTVYGAAFTVTVLPSTAGSRPRRRTHSPCDRTTTWPLPRVSSAATKSRPSSGRTPSTRKYSWDTRPAATFSGGSMPSRSAVDAMKPASAAKLRFLARQPRYTARPVSSRRSPPAAAMSCQTV